MLADGPQHPVAGTMTEGIVERLEMVDVDHHHPDRLPMPHSTMKFALQRGFQITTVEEAGQRIADSLTTQGLAQFQIGEAQPALVHRVEVDKRLQGIWVSSPNRGSWSTSTATSIASLCSRSNTVTLTLQRALAQRAVVRKSYYTQRESRSGNPPLLQTKLT